MRNACITAIEYYLPEQKLTNHELAGLFSGRTPEEIAHKTGVSSRSVAAEEECCSDLGVTAAQKAFASGTCTPDDIDFLLFCTETPDYFFPATACLAQARLGIPVSAGALDFNLGCSGFVYGLGLAKGLIQTGQANRVLLITADLLSRFIGATDRAARAVFGDAGAATIIEAVDSDDEIGLGSFVYGTDGRGAEHFILREGALRGLSSNHQKPSGGAGLPALKMNGQKIMEFAIGTVPDQIRRLLTRAELSIADVDLFVFHQSSRYVLEMLRHILHIPEEKFFISLEDCGNTVSSTIPVALRRASGEGKLLPGHTVVTCGYGVGLSWGASILKWTPLKVQNVMKTDVPALVAG